MSAPFGVEACCERASISSGTSTLWAGIRIDPRGKGLETQRAPLAIALVIDVSGSMRGDPIANVLRSCELVTELLDERDRISIITFGDHAGVRIGLTACDDDGRKLVRAALHAVTAGGSTIMHVGSEAGAGLLASAPNGLRRAMVVLSDGQPNIGLSSPDQLAQVVTALRPIGVSSLGFGIHHDENVLTAIATAGSGRYAYVSDPIAARLDLARAALAHGGIVAESLQLELRPTEGVELLRILPATQLRHGGRGARAAIGDVFVDEHRVVALELSVTITGSTAATKGHLADLVIEGKSPDGTVHTINAKLVVDVHGGPHVVVRDAQRDILLLRANAARSEARAHSDRGGDPAAVSLLREIVKQIDSSDGFVADDGTLLAEMREQLIDEANNYERGPANTERGHQLKGAAQYVPTVTTGRRGSGHAPGALVGLSHGAQNQRFRLYCDTSIGRSQDNEIPLSEPSLSRRHARIMYLDDKFVLTDLGSTNGCEVNSRPVMHDKAELRDGDIVKLGFVEFRFERKRP